MKYILRLAACLAASTVNFAPTVAHAEMMAVVREAMTKDRECMGRAIFDRIAKNMKAIEKPGDADVLTQVGLDSCQKSRDASVDVLIEQARALTPEGAKYNYDEMRPKLIDHVIQIDKKWAGEFVSEALKDIKGKKWKFRRAPNN